MRKPRLNKAVATVAVEMVLSLLRVASLRFVMGGSQFAVIPGRAKREPGISRFRVRCFASPRNDGNSSELHVRHRLDFGSGGAEVEEILAGEAEHAGEQGGRHLLDAGVVFLDRVVEEATAGRDLVFEVG